jgi:hypothetical protein
MSDNIEFTKKLIEGQQCLLSNTNINKSPLTFIIIPGNPSIIELYKDFAKLFLKKYNYPVIISSLATNISKNFSLEKAIQLKQNFFEYLFNINPKGKYIVLCHSIGNYIFLKSLQKIKDTKQIISIYCLFPAMQNLYKCFPLEYKIMSYNILIINFIACFSFLFQVLPLCLIILFFKMISDVPSTHVECLARNATPSITKQMLLLTRDEGNFIKEYSNDFIEFLKENSYRLKMIYGKFDRYGNEETANKFHELVPNAYIKVVDILHAFVLGYSQEMFDTINDLIQKDIENIKKEININENI